MKRPTHKLTKPHHVPSELPLNAGGSITCITCHDCASGTCILRKSSLELCLVCHDYAKGMACLIGKAHLGDTTDLNHAAAYCLGCHNGTIGKLVGGPHPIDVLYISARDHNALSDKRIVLLDGKVTCVSCHNPYSKTKAKLTKSNERGQLCLTCHRK